MTTRGNGHFHSDQSDGETDAETSRNNNLTSQSENLTSQSENMTSENENLISLNENTNDIVSSLKKLQQHGGPASENREQLEETSLEPLSTEPYTTEMPESRQSEVQRIRAGLLMRMYRSVTNKLSSITSRRRSLEIVPEEELVPEEEQNVSNSSGTAQDELKRGAMRRMFETFEKREEADKTPSEVIDDLFTHCCEQTVLETFHEVIHMGKDLNEVDRDSLGNTVLHRAVQKNFLSVAEKFLDYGINPLAYNFLNRIPLNYAIDRGYDDMAAMILSKLKKSVVRRIFGDGKSEVTEQKESKDSENITQNKQAGCFDEDKLEPMYNINTLIERDLDQTLIRVLDSFTEEQQDGQYDVHVKHLDTDDKGREPTHPDFDFKNHTVFQNLATCEKKDALNHPVLRTLAEYKWRKWCQQRFLFYCGLYLFSLFSLSYSAVTGVTAPDVHNYDSKLQHSRAMFELISYLYSISVLFTEIRQMIRHKLHYFTQFYNWVEVCSASLLVLTLPLRYAHTETHWYTFAVGYFLWAIRIFKYSSAFDHMAIYTEIIKRILAQDFVKFSILFLVINTIFSGTFLLVLKADETLDTHSDTSSFQGIMYVGVRTLIEAAPIVDYTGSYGYRAAGTIVMLVYMFFTIVVMLNILIAQMSETYQRTLNDCVKTVRANRAWIIARAERNEWHILPRRPNRVIYYMSKIKHVDIKSLEKKDASEMEVLSANIAAMKKKQLKNGLEIQTLKTRLRYSTSNLEMKMDKLSNQLKEIQQLLKSRH